MPSQTIAPVTELEAEGDEAVTQMDGKKKKKKKGKREDEPTPSPAATSGAGKKKGATGISALKAFHNHKEE